MKTFLLSLLLIILSFLYPPHVDASQALDMDKKIVALEKKVSKKFAKTYCNTSSFGISEEGALKFAIGETNVEFSKKKFIDKIDVEEVKDKILVDIADICGYYDFEKSELNALNFDS